MFREEELRPSFRAPITLMKSCTVFSAHRDEVMRGYFVDTWYLIALVDRF